MNDTASATRTRKRRITLPVVKALKVGEIVWDSEIKGFGVRRQREAKIYVVKYRAGGRQRWYKIGRHGSPWTPGKARTEAKRILGQVADKKDPAAFRDAAKENPTVKELAEAFLKEHVEAKRRPTTQFHYRDLTERLILPRVGKVRVADVTRSDVAKLHHSLKGTPYQANRTLAVLAKMFAWAERHGYRADGTNPCRHVEKYPERKRERFLSETELALLGEVLAEAEGKGENAYVIAAIRLLIFTGARLGEILNLEWEHVDFERALLRLPESKTGQKAIYLSAPALATLAAIPRQERNPFVICGAKEVSALVNLEKPWRRLRARATIRLWAEHSDPKISGLITSLRRELKKQARDPSPAECRAAAKAAKIELPRGLDDVRLHDLRHSFASVAAAGGLSLPMIGKLLGHTQAATTHRYAHLAADPVRAANEAIGQRIAAMMKGGDRNEDRIVKLSERKA